MYSEDAALSEILGLKARTVYSCTYSPASWTGCSIQKYFMNLVKIRYGQSIMSTVMVRDGLTEPDLLMGVDAFF